MPTYNHAFDIAFEVPNSTDPKGEDVTPAQLKAALIRRIQNLDETNEWEEAIGCPFDTYEED